MNTHPSDPAPPDEVARLRARVAELEAALASAPPRDEPPATAHHHAVALLDTLFAKAPIGLAFVDTDLRFMRVNAHLAEINGPSPEAHIGRTIFDILPDLAAELAPLYRQVLETGEAIRDTEISGTTPGAPGRTRAWLCSYYPVPGERGQIIGVGVVLVEITERKQAEAELQRQAATLGEQAELLDLAHVLIRAPDGRISFWNRGAEELYGWTRDEAVGQVSHELFQTRFPVPIEEFEAAIRTKGEWMGELVHRRKDGAEIVVASHHVLARDAAGRPRSVVEVNNDITGRRRVEDDLRRMADRLSMLNTIDRAILAAHTPEQIARVIIPLVRQLVPCDRIAIAAYEPEQRRLRQLDTFDVRAERVPAGGYIPIDDRDLLPPFALGEHWYAPDTDQAEALSPRAIPHRTLRLRSLIHFPLVAEGQLLGILRLASAQPQAFTLDDIAVVRDIADQLAIALRGANLRTQIEQERALLARRVTERTADLSAANAELARAVRVKDEFLSNMSHELRTPLNAILGRTELLREQIYGPLTAGQEAAAQSIATAAQHLLELINDILDLSKVEAGRLDLVREVVAVSEVCQASLMFVRELALRKRLQVGFHLNDQLARMGADTRRLKQILVNLLSNAVKFTPEGGRIGLDVHADAERESVTFTVWDTGIGISPTDQARLFQPFVQIDSSVSRQHDGSGLGLTLVMRLAELHGGSVALESTPEQGSRFSVTLPWVAGSAEPAAPAEPAAQAPPIRQALVIEDSHTTAEQLSRYLGELGSQVQVHDRASGAVERARALRPDLIILDILLPDQTGWEVLRQLKADPHTASIPVLVASVVDEPARAFALGATGFVLKPLTRESFLAALRGMPRPAEAVAAPDPALALIVAPQQRPLVLLVDDNDANLAALIDYLPVKGYEVIIARNGTEAVAQAEERRPAAIVMDIQMPVMDGLEATRRIRAAGLRDTPILALTALAMPGDRERCLAAGADDYLTKPVSLQRVAAWIAARLPSAGRV